MSAIESNLLNIITHTHMGFLTLLLLLAAVVHARAGFLPTVTYTGCPVTKAQGCSSSIVSGITSTADATVITSLFVTGTCSILGKSNTRTTLSLPAVATLCNAGAALSAAEWAACAQLPATKTFMCSKCACA